MVMVINYLSDVCINILGTSSVTPSSSTPAQTSEVQESQHGSSATSLSLSESLESTSPPHESVSIHNLHGCLFVQLSGMVCVSVLGKTIYCCM